MAKRYVIRVTAEIDDDFEITGYPKDEALLHAYEMFEDKHKRTLDMCNSYELSTRVIEQGEDPDDYDEIGDV